MADTKEVEIKLEMPPAALRRLRRHPLIQGHKTGRGVVQNLRSVYFDTPDLLLRAHGVSLRVRHVGKRRVQTMKARGESAAGLFSRREWECEIDGDSPRLDLLWETEFSKVLGNAADTALAPVFTTVIRRTLYHLRGEEWEAKLALDDGEVTSPSGRLPISEAEFELVRGSPRCLFDLALGLQRTASLRVATISKSDRGYALLTGAAPAPRKAREIPLRRKMTAAQAFQTAARGCLKHLVANYPPVLTGDDPEGVHQMRVALRRLRSLISLFRVMLGGAETRAMLDGMRWLGRTLGPARDMDVFAEEILAPVLAAFPDDPGLEALSQAVRLRRAELRGVAQDAVASDHFTRFLLSLGAWIEGGEWLDQEGRTGPLHRPATEVVSAVLSRRHQAVLKAGRKIERLPPEALHDLRIRIKKLRYAVEIMGRLYGARKVKPFLAPHVKMQNRLGDLNDVDVARDILATLPDHEGAKGIVLGWHTARSTALREKALKNWDKAKKAKPFWQ